MATGDLKIDRINGAYSLLRISGITVQPTSENNKLAINVFESLMNELKDKNICMNYNFEDAPNVNTKSGLRPGSYNSIDSVLALRLQTHFGKGFRPDPSLISQAKAGSSYLYSVTADPNVTDYPSRQPVGSGTQLRSYRYRRFFYPLEHGPDECETNHMPLDPDNPNVNDYVEHYDSYLRDGEDIASFTIDADSGLTIVSSSLSTSKADINYRVKAVGANEYTETNVLQVQIVVTTTDDRVETRLVTFELERTTLD